jgi:hypothetical protein
MEGYTPRERGMQFVQTPCLLILTWKILWYESTPTAEIDPDAVGGSARETMAVYENAGQVSHTISHTVTTA